MAATATRRKTAAKPKVVEVEPEVIEDDELDEEEFEVEELEEDEVEAEKPRKVSAKERANAAVTFGVAHLAAHIEKLTGEAVTTRELRGLIRKMARDGSGRIGREIVAGNRSRYDWPTGAKDPEVKAIVKAFTDGELAADKQEKLDALKVRKAEQMAEKKAAAEAAEAAPTNGKKSAAKVTPIRRAKKAAAPVVVEEDDEELDLDDEE